MGRATDWDDPALRAEIAARLKGGDKTAALRPPLNRLP